MKLSKKINTKNKIGIPDALLFLAADASKLLAKAVTDNVIAKLKSDAIVFEQQRVGVISELYVTDRLLYGLCTLWGG